jgi:hypothetical protein
MCEFETMNQLHLLFIPFISIYICKGGGGWTRTEGRDSLGSVLGRQVTHANVAARQLPTLTCVFM